MAKRWPLATAIFVGIFVIVFVIASLVVREIEHERERACAERCIAKGFATYTYEGFSGARRSFLGVDSCTCNDAGGTSSHPGK